MRTIQDFHQDSQFGRTRELLALPLARLNGIGEGSEHELTDKPPPVRAKQREVHIRGRPGGQKLGHGAELVGSRFVVGVRVLSPRVAVAP